MCAGACAAWRAGRNPTTGRASLQRNKRPACGPALGVWTLRKSVASPMYRPRRSRQSVRCVPDRNRTLRTARAQRSLHLQTRVQTANALNNSRYICAAVCVRCAQAVTRRRWIGWTGASSRICRAPAGTATCLAMTSHSQVKLSAPELHHDCMSVYILKVFGISGG